jgi:hypothetical protein
LNSVVQKKRLLTKTLCLHRTCVYKYGTLLSKAVENAIIFKSYSIIARYVVYSGHYLFYFTSFQITIIRSLSEYKRHSNKFENERN